jgi:O-antigen/teichoic acid export membrane protein
MIITQLLGPAEVTPYNIAFKYFGIPIMVFTIILTPFWSAYTEAITKNDISWIKSTVRKLVKIWFIMVIGVGLMLIVAKPFYRVWVGDKVHIPFMLSAFMGLYAIISTWNNIFAYFINGVGKIKLQMYYGIIAMIINIPISIFFAKTLNMGSAGVILGTCASLIIGSFFAPIQSWKIIKGNAKGIWNK